MNAWQHGVMIEGEKFMARKRNGLAIVIDDYRDDFDYVDAHQEALGNEIEEEGMGSALEMAKAALAAIPDISCLAIAEAFGMSEFAVRAISTGRHNRANNKSLELSWYTREEIMGAICANNQQ